MGSARKGVSGKDHHECTICSSPLTARQTKFCSPNCSSEGAKRRRDTKYKEDLFCLNCEAKLTGRQTKYCTKVCRIDHANKVYEELIATGEKECASCLEVKPLEEFHSRRDTADRLYADCKLCIVKSNGDRLAARPDTRRAYNLRVNYGITLEEYTAMLLKQEGKCAICKRFPRGQKLAVDHDHVTGKIRGLLCTSCNLRVIGKQRSPDIFQAAADYLSDPPGQEVLPDRVVPSSRPIDRQKRKRYRSRGERKTGRRRPS